MCYYYNMRKFHIPDKLYGEVKLRAKLEKTAWFILQPLTKDMTKCRLCGSVTNVVECSCPTEKHMIGMATDTAIKAVPINAVIDPQFYIIERLISP